MSRRVIIVDTTTSAQGVNMWHRNRGMGCEVSESWLEPTNILCYKIGDSLPYASDFALDFVPDVVYKIHQYKPHYPYHAVFKFDEKTDVVATMGRFLEYFTRLQVVVLGCQTADIARIDGVNKLPELPSFRLCCWREIVHGLWSH